MEELICKRTVCNNPVPETRKAGSFYCCDPCGWKQRNHDNRVKLKERRLHEKKLNKNYKIIKELFDKRIYDVSSEALLVLEFDIKYCTGIKEVTGNKTVINLYEFVITYQGDRYKIKKS
ncbi:hypothetical protein ACFLRQ_03075 [Bacteroidota bacterium]